MQLSIELNGRLVHCSWGTNLWEHEEDTYEDNEEDSEGDYVPFVQVIQ